MPRLVKSLLMMRKRGLLGPFFAHHSGVTHLSKSVGSFIAGTSIFPLLKFTQGWTGIEDCGNLLNFKMDVGTDGLNQFGYRDPTDGVSPFGSMVETAISESIIYAAHVNTATNVSNLRFGNGFQQIQGRNTVTVTWQGYPTLIYLWNGTNLNYEVTDVGLTNWITSLNGQRVSLDIEYIAIMATVDGTTALRRAVVTGGEANETTVSMWVWRDSGVNTSQKMYDIGDGVTSGNDTTRFRLSATAQLKSILSNVVGGIYTEVSSVTKTNASITEDVMHHFYMTAKNDIVDGVGTQVMELWVDGILEGTDTTFFPNNSTTFSFVAGDFVTLLARHDLSQMLTGRVADIWSGGKYMDGATNVAKFRKSSPADVAWNGGVPVDLGSTGIVNGVTPGNYLGGNADYSIADYNAGLNRGSNGNFTRIGSVIT